MKAVQPNDRSKAAATCSRNVVVHCADVPIRCAKSVPQRAAQSSTAICSLSRHAFGRDQLVERFMRDQPFLGGSDSLEDTR